MRVVNKGIVAVLFMCTVNLSFLPYVFAETLPSKSDSRITINPPEMMTSPEERMPVEEVKETGYNKWLWIGLGVLAVGAAAAMASGGGGGGGGDDGSSAPAATSNEGNVEVTW